jgi:hypothetical protein
MMRITSSSSLVSLGFLLITTSASAQVIDRGPWLQTGTPNSIVVRWRTDIDTDGRLRYGDAPGNLINMIDDGLLQRAHEITIPGLSADTTYYYSVGTAAAVLAGDDLDHVFTNAPTAGTDKPTRIWVLGDSGTADAAAAAVRDAYYTLNGSPHADVWLMLGDNAYNSGTGPEYQAAVFDMYPMTLQRTPLWPTLGNHDSSSADSPTQSGVYYTVFTLPTAGEAGGLPSGTEAYYSFNYANIHFICLDSDDTPRGVNQAMLTWLADDLADASADWLIAFWHHPPYTKGSHDSDNVGDSSGRMRDMRENALPILEAAGVDLVLSGHSHSYERSFLLDGHYGVSSTLVPSMILDGGSGDPDDTGAYQKPTLGLSANEGAVYVVAGSSGKNSGGPLNHMAMHISLDQQGSVVIDVNGNRLDAKFLRRTGAIQDRFTMIKGSVVGDTNGDCTVNITDLGAVLANFGTAVGATLADGDVDGDGDVDITDLGILLANFGQTC